MLEGVELFLAQPIHPVLFVRQSEGHALKDTHRHLGRSLIRLSNMEISGCYWWHKCREQQDKIGTTKDIWEASTLSQYVDRRSVLHVINANAIAFQKQVFSASCEVNVMSATNLTSGMIKHVQYAIRCVDQPIHSHGISQANIRKRNLEREDWYGSNVGRTARFEMS